MVAKNPECAINYSTQGLKENTTTDSKERQLGRTLRLKYARDKALCLCKMPTPWQQPTSKKKKNVREYPFP